MLKNFTKSVFIYGFAPTFGKFIGIFLLPIYTKVFTPGEYGVIDLFNVIIYFFIVFIDLQIYSAIGRYFNETKDIKNRQVLISTAFWNEIGLSLFVIFFISIFSRSINLRLLHTLQYQNAFLIALLWLPVSCIFTYLSVIMRYEKKPLLFLIVATVQIIVKVTVSLITILVFNWGIVGIFIGQIAGDFIGSILFFIYLKKYIIFSYNIQVLKKLLCFSVPLVPAMLALYFNNSFNRFVMLKYLSLEAIGLYAVALKVASVFGLIGGAFRMAWNPFMYESLERSEHKKMFIRIYKLVMLSLIVPVIGITLFSKEILMFLTTEKYFSAYPLIGFLSIYLVLNLFRQIVGIGPKIVKKTLYDSISIIAGVIVNILALYVFVPIYGIMGAGYSLCFGGVVTLGLSWYFTYKLYPINYPKILTICLIFVMFFIAFFNKMFDVNIIFKVIIVSGLLLPLLFYYRNRITGIYSGLVFTINKD